MKKITAILTAIMLLCTAFIVSACKEVRLPTPAYGYVDDNDNLYWSQVENARSYEIEITNADGETVTLGSRRATYSLSTRPEGDYDIRVRAVGAQGAYSDWSEVISYYKPADYGYTFRSINDGTAWALASARSSVGDVVIEETYRNKPILQVADGAFRNNQEVTSVEFRGKIESIGESAFLSCISLTTVIIPDTVTSIGEAAFQGCTLLKEAYFPDSEDMNAIPDYMYAYCSSIEKINIPEGIVSIGESAFSNCISLTDVVIPDSVETIGTNAFTRNAQLASVTLGSGLTSIGNYAFLHNDKLTSVTFAESYESLELGNQCFAECALLAKVDLPAGTVAVPTGCFSNDAALAEVTIPDSVTSVGAQAFRGTALLAKQEGFAYVDSWLVSASAETLAELTEIGQYDFREGTVGIAARVFYTDETSGCPNLSVANFPASVKYIGDYAFYGCNVLYRFTVPEDSLLDTLGAGAFYGCGLLRVVNLGRKLKTIGNYAFYNCTAVDNNSLNPEYLVPASVTHIGADAFYGTALYGASDAYGIIYAGDWAVGYDDSRTTIAVTLKESVRGIADYCFYDNQNIQSVDNLARVRYIGTAAFMNCQKLLAASLNMNLAAIEDYTFFQCMALGSVNFPEALTRIGFGAFYQCDQLTTVDLSATQIKTIGDFAFFSCAINSLQLNEGLESVGIAAFHRNMLQELEIPSSMVSIGDSAFGQCMIRQLTIHEGIKEIGNYAFYNAFIQTLELPESVERIGTGAFLSCSQLSEVHFGSDLKEIGPLAFAYSPIGSLTLPASLEGIGAYAFLACSDLTSAVLPESLESIGQYAFFGCTSATFYTALDEVPAGWGLRWNPSFRPVFWGAEISEEGYVVSVDTAKLENATAPKADGAPFRAGYDFLGWTAAEGGAADFTMSDLMTLTEAAKFYAVYVPSESSIPDVQ